MIALLLAACAPPCAPLPTTEIDFAGLAASLLERKGYEDVPLEEFDFEAFLETKFLRARIGLYELYLPLEAAAVKSSAEDFKTVAAALVEAQQRWLDWLEPLGIDQQQARKDLGEVEGWVSSWRGGAIATVAKGEARDLLAGLQARANVVAAAGRLADYMDRGGPLALEREPKREPVLIAPRRRDFMEYISFAGWMYPDLQSLFWQPAVSNWTNFYMGDCKVIALELPAPGRAAGDWEKGVSMNDERATGMAQQVVQLSINSLVDNFFGDRVPPAFAGGLAFNLVVDLYGECATRVDGDLRERRTDAREIFVPGGLSQGGVLPVNSAETRWREDQGSDRFVRVVRQSQKNGASMEPRGEDKLRYFRLMDDDRIERHVVAGPFLGSAAQDVQQPPENFAGDWLEFLRSYRGCFVHWLRNETDRAQKKANADFATLLRELAHAEPNAIEEVFVEVYGVPLSDPELSEDCLEGRFLRWLSKK